MKMDHHHDRPAIAYSPAYATEGKQVPAAEPRAPSRKLPAEKLRLSGEPGVMIPVREQWHVGQARRAAKALAQRLGLAEVATYSIATSVSELANNLLFYARDGGTITLRAVARNRSVGVEVVVHDHGPGIADLGLAMRDGFTTSGGLGGGLPGVKRLMDEFEITSQLGAGTRVVARRWQKCS